MKLTIAQALEQGYTKVGTDASGWQHLHDIEDLSSVDFESKTKYFLADKEAQYHLRETKDLAEMIADRISDDYADETGCDDVNDILEQIKALDFSSINQKINYVMTQHPYWHLTKIELVP
jgi:hypothetical protein